MAGHSGVVLVVVAVAVVVMVMVGVVMMGSGGAMVTARSLRYWKVESLISHITACRWPSGDCRLRLKVNEFASSNRFTPATVC